MGDRYPKSHRDNNTNSNIDSNNKTDSTNDNNTTIEHIHDRNFCKGPRGTIWYINTINLNGLGMMQKLPYKDIGYVCVSLEEILNTDDK